MTRFKTKTIEKVIGWVAKKEQFEQIGRGETEKQGSLRIFVTGKVTGLGIKNCEMLQDVVESIDVLIKQNESIVVH